jgi:hypothetical protein
LSEFEDRINSLLNDPKQMDKIAALAKSLMGEEGGTQKPQGTAKAAESGGLDPDMLGKLTGLFKNDGSEDGGLGLDPAMLGKLAGILKKGGSENSERTALLNAMKPYLSEKRRSKMDKAMKLARIAKIAELAAGEFGGDGDV